MIYFLKRNQPFQKKAFLQPKINRNPNRRSKKNQTEQVPFSIKSLMNRQISLLRKRLPKKCRIKKNKIRSYRNRKK